MLSAERIGVKIGRSAIVHDVSIEIAPGEVVAVLGANGAGKSTLLKVLSGEITPTSGRVTIDGRPLSSLAPTELARRRAVLAQESQLTASFTVMEVVLLGRTPYFTVAPSQEDRRIAIEACVAADVEHLVARAYPTLSGGEKQRVHLARSLAQLHDLAGEPRYLLLDEPTSSLDLAHQGMVLRVARSFAARGGGVIAILHDPNLAAQFADRLLLMKEGSVVAAGSPRCVLTTEHIRSAFGVESVVLEHPAGNWPLVVPIMNQCPPASEGRTGELAAGARPLTGRRAHPISG